MKKNRNDETPFLDYLKNKVVETIKDISTIFYTLIFVGAFVYSAFEDGIGYAFEYFMIVVVFLFLVYFYAMIILHIKYRVTTRNSWILYSIVLTILAIASYFVLSTMQIRYLTIMSFVVVVICMGVPYLVELLRKRIEK
ncbi:hypothetical protein ACMA1I_16160 [Pontibacter sp. 13R65]|uniref:hypothetical protein n=1 Tax=Pontibacter sp. 13R65 TaxID=3127458 RepID=UPI00301CFD98